MTLSLPSRCRALMLMCLVGCSSTASVWATDYYVATSGNDQNLGTLEAPFQTLEKAKQVVQKSLPVATDGIHVWIRGGTYSFDSTLEFGPEDSGSKKVPVSYSGYSNETVVISGAIPLEATWKPYSENIQVADIGTGLKFDGLFVNNEQQVMARYPNFDSDIVVLNGYAKDATSKERAARWKNPSTGFVRALHQGRWGGQSYKISGLKSNGDLLLDWVGDNNRGKGMHKEYRMVENLFEELDAPNEWFYDEAEGKLYFHPPADLDLSTATIEVASTEELIRIVGTADEKVKHLTFDKLTFAQTHRTLFTGTYEPLQRSDWMIVRSGAFFIQDAENITISNSIFDHLGGNGIFFSAYNRNHLVTQNEFFEIGATCVNFVGIPSAVRDPGFWDNYPTEINDDTPGPLTDDYPAECTASYNHMQNNGRFEKQTCGVNISMAESITVSHNTVHGSPRAGINICDGTWGGHLIEFNDLFDCVRETSDHGPFNSWGRDRFYALGGYNHNGGSGRKKRPYALLDAWKTTVIRNNRVHYNEPTSFGIDLDDGSSNYEIYNNLLLNTEIKLREGFDRKVYNNIQINMQNEFHVWYDESRDIFINNIVVSRTGYNAKYMNSRKARGAEATLDKNLFYNGGNGVTLSDDHWVSSGYDANSVIADPLFVDPDTLDYSVMKKSPALELGFKNFPMDQFGKPGAPQPSPIQFLQMEEVEADPEPLMGAVIASINSMSIQSVLGAPAQAGIYFESVPAGSYAAKKGFKKHDAILAVNGTAITTKESFWTVYNALEPGAKIKITRLRNQHEKSFTFKKMDASK